ncbi:hypothetical protein [Mycobacterium sp. M23085]|uniref:hypothetical protein n=1 Tax=Mycobacterium sp. M23085 TaxID=3378087 RepID=UPI003877B239
MNIEPDINCPHCGPVILCPHTSSNVSASSNQAPTNWGDFNWTGNFLENSRRIKASAETQEANPGPGRIDAAPPGGNPTYVRAAIGAELQRLASSREGSRNDTLLRVACNVYEFVKGGHASQTAVHTELTRIAAAIGLQQSEIRATLRSAWERVGPRDVPSLRGAV